MTTTAADERPPCPRGHRPTDAWCGDEPSLLCELERIDRTARPTDRLVLNALVYSHAWLTPTRELLLRLGAMGPLVEICAGNGYWARLLRDLGADVIAIDSGGWDVEPVAYWSEVTRGDETLLREHADRVLLMVMPPRPGAGPIIDAFPGTQMVVVTSFNFPNRKMVFDSEADAANALDQGGWQLADRYHLPDPLDPDIHANFFER